MDYAAIAALVDGQTGTSQELADWANTPSIETRSPYYVSYRTIASIVKDTAKLEAMSSAVAGAMPTFHTMLLAVGKTDGEAGGINIAEEETQYSIMAFATPAGGNLLTEAQADEICALGTSLITPAASIGLSRLAASDIEVALGTRPLVQMEVSNG